MLITNESVLNLKEKQITSLIFLLSNCLQFFKIVFDDFGILCQLGCRIELSCLYIPQGHYFISTLWLLNTDEYLKF